MLGRVGLSEESRFRRGSWVRAQIQAARRSHVNGWLEQKRPDVGESRTRSAE